MARLSEVETPPAATLDSMLEETSDWNEVSLTL